MRLALLRLLLEYDGLENQGPKADASPVEHEEDEAGEEAEETEKLGASGQTEEAQGPFQAKASAQPESSSSLDVHGRFSLLRQPSAQMQILRAPLLYAKVEDACYCMMMFSNVLIKFSC